jgi:hypothetical protein
LVDYFEEITKLSNFSLLYRLVSNETKEQILQSLGEALRVVTEKKLVQQLLSLQEKYKI